MLTIAVHDETPLHRHLRLLAADLVLRVPVLSEFARKTGSTLACNPDAERLLRNGEYVGCVPGRVQGHRQAVHGPVQAAALWSRRVRLSRAADRRPDRAGLHRRRRGDLPDRRNFKPLAKVAGLPYLPITPLFPWLGHLGMLPLPSKWLIEFGEPMRHTIRDEVDDPIVVFNLADQVRETIQQTLHGLLEDGPDPFG
jgi:1-acyl-sn-glycerol-3-phosphate acyltransferase